MNNIQKAAQLRMKKKPKFSWADLKEDKKDNVKPSVAEDKAEATKK